MRLVEGLKSAEKNKDEILEKLEETFSQLTDVKDLRCTCTVVNKLLELSTDTCCLGIGGIVCREVLHVHVTQDVPSIGS